MKWEALYNKIGKQRLSIIRKTDVVVLINGETFNVAGIKFKVHGEPYLIVENKKEI